MTTYTGIIFYTYGFRKADGTYFSPTHNVWDMQLTEEAARDEAVSLLHRLSPHIVELYIYSYNSITHKYTLLDAAD